MFRCTGDKLSGPPPVSAPGSSSFSILFPMADEELLPKVYLLMDCNNFFVSCERIFRPDLEGRPVVVLSNNDGCVVARSPEVRAMGIGMGTPAFKIQAEASGRRIVFFSSNFNLYLDISQRIMRLLDEISPEVLLYSIDEAFVVLRHVTPAQALATACRIKKTIERCVGVPVSLGIARSRTLAKIAAHHAKKTPAAGGVVSLLDRFVRERILQLYEISEIWGIGRQLNEKLRAEGFRTMAQLAAADADDLRRRYSVVLWSTVRELNEYDEIREDAAPHLQNQIMWSRSFRQRLSTEQELSEALCSFAARAASRLRQLQLYTRLISVEIRTSYFGTGAKYSGRQSISLNAPTHDSRVIMAAVNLLLKKCFRQGYAYAKAGVLLADLCPSRRHQGDLFAPEESGAELQRSDALMELIDQHAGGRPLLYLGAQGRPGREQAFNDKRLLSPACTTDLTLVPELY